MLRISAAKIGKSIKRTEKKDFFQYFRSLIDMGNKYPFDRHCGLDPQIEDST